MSERKAFFFCSKDERLASILTRVVTLVYSCAFSQVQIKIEFPGTLIERLDHLKVSVVHEALYEGIEQTRGLLAREGNYHASI
jgi:hypothetical protein